jgi:parvulin-like peptidyl-prolyl isomerase
MNKQVFKMLLVLQAALFLNTGFSQPKMIDKIVAVVGDKAILFSEVESQSVQLETQSGVKDSLLRCKVL